MDLVGDEVDLASLWPDSSSRGGGTTPQLSTSHQTLQPAQVLQGLMGLSTAAFHLPETMMQPH